jgi:MFS family permease
MLCGSLVYHSAQVALPKLFALRLEALVGGSAFGIGSLIAFVYGMAALTQVTAGHVADRWPLKPVYASAFLLQVPLFWLISRIGGPALVLTAGAALVVNTGALPAENMLLAAATPRDRHGLVFGLKFVLAFGAAPLSIWLVSGFADSIGGFGWIFSVLALLAAIGCLAALLLPRPVARLAPPAAAT